MSGVPEIRYKNLVREGARYDPDKEQRSRENRLELRRREDHIRVLRKKLAFQTMMHARYKKAYLKAVS